MLKQPNNKNSDEASFIKRINELENQNEELHKQLEQQNYNNILRAAFEGDFLTNAVGKDFFNLLSQYLTKELSVDYVFIGSIKSDNEDEIQTLATSAFGKLSENIEYSLRHGPCEQIIKGVANSYPNQCKQLFPKNQLIQKYNIEGYVGYPLYNSQNKAIGLIAVFNQKPLADIQQTEALLKIVSKRTELEMERMDYEKALERNIEKLHKKIQAQFNELLVERQTLHNFFMQAPAILAIFKGPEHIFELANPRFTQLFGKRYLLGKTVREALPELEEQAFFEILDTVYSTGEPYVGTEMPVMLNNETGTQEKGYFNFIYQAFKDKKGEIEGILFFAVDVTQQVIARKQSEQNTAMLKKLYMQTPAIICTLSGPDHVYDLINPSYQKIFGKRDLLGKKIMDALPELKGQNFIELLDKVYSTGESFVGNDMLLLLSQEENTTPQPAYFNFSYQPLYNENNSITGILIFGYEVTDQVLARKKIEESAERIRIIGEAMPQKVWTASPQGNINYLNQRWLDYSGKTFDELKDLGWQSVIHPDDLDKFKESWLHSINSGNPFEMEHRIMQKDGTYHWHLTRGIAQKNRYRKTLLWVGTNTDIDDKKTEEEATKKNQVYTRSLIEASLDPLITISPEGKITDVNEATEEITGIPRDKLIGTHFFYHFTDPVKASKGYQKVFSKGFVSDYPLTIRHRKGKLTPVLFNGSIYKDENGKVLGSVVTARDITQLIRNEQELLQAKSNAEHAAELAKEAVKAKQQFLSTMSHEIRTPMNAILGFTQIMHKTKLDTDQKEYLSAIQTSGDTLLLLINDILDLAKIEAGKMDFEQLSFNLNDSINALLHTFEIKIKEKNLELITFYDNSIPETIIGDPTRLNQIILNLISNAIKFTSEGKISINVNLLQQDDENIIVQFSITDTGIGIPQDRLEHIFENFQQANSDTSRNYGGTGLGLAIVKKLVEGQGGKLNVKSILNEGSTFSFFMPFGKTEAIQNTETTEYNLLSINSETVNTTLPSSDNNSSSIKVLVAEDNRINQYLMKKLLTDLGYNHDIAENGKVAIEKLEKNNYDIILMDLQMPVMNGLETTGHIRTIIKSKIPIILLTADVTTMDEAKCKEAGMNDYISKPVNEKILNEKMLKLLNGSIN